MDILGISLGHDSSLALISDGEIIQIFEVERFFRQKRYKLHCLDLEKGKHPSTYQMVDIEDLELILGYIAKAWGVKYDCIAIQNQGRQNESENLIKILSRQGIKYNSYHSVDHHLSHAALSYFTSPFNNALVLSYDGMGNDGQTIVFDACGNNIKYHLNSYLKMGSCYNNLGYILGISPEICGTTSGKTMGLTAYGNYIEEWEQDIRKHIMRYEKKPRKIIDGLNNYGKAHTINSDYIDKIPDFSKYVSGKLRMIDKIDILNRFIDKPTICINDLKAPISHDLAKTFQSVWTNIVLELLKDVNKEFGKEYLCVTGGCALNGITNYNIETSLDYKSVHYIPNPSDCGLAAGSGLYVYWMKSDKPFNGYEKDFSPYIGMDVFDKNESHQIASEFMSFKLESGLEKLVLAKILYDNYIVGVINGPCEIGPRALGNRSILCNPLNRKMRDILNEKVKHREWYRPFAPIVTSEDSKTYFTNRQDIPYMSVICYTKQEYQGILPSITHVDGSARVQTVRKEQHGFMYDLLKEYERISGYPILLNTSFNPGGEPILNYLKVGLEMLNTTELDFVFYDGTIYWSKKCSQEHKNYISKLYEDIRLR